MAARPGQARQEFAMKYFYYKFLYFSDKLLDSSLFVSMLATKIRYSYVVLK